MSGPDKRGRPYEREGECERERVRFSGRGDLERSRRSGRDE